MSTSVPAPFHAVVKEWFQSSFGAPTDAQARAWPHILRGESTLLLAPTGSGKTLAAFLGAIHDLAFDPNPPAKGTSPCRVLYISPLKALAVDIERNLRAPIAGIHALAERHGITHHVPTLAIRTGDTPQSDRARQRRSPPDIFITTPESLFLMLTSDARSVLANVRTVIVDEIHAMVPSKRGTHLFLSLERLERLRGASAPPLQRIGLSATQRPLDEVARLLGGGTVDAHGTWTPRKVNIVDAGARRSLEIRVEVPVDDMAALSERAASKDSGPEAPSIWPAIHPRLVELIKQHRSTMIFANSRRLAERLATALNDVAGSEIALAHHGSIAKEKRADIEDRLKRGLLPAIVATSSMELGLDIGAVDLVIQVEAPPSVASGMQRIGRASHQVGATSRGIMFPKYRGDLLACASASARMQEGLVEATVYPRNALDVLAQQLVAMCALENWHVDEMFALVRGAAPYADLPRASFDGVLDMLSGRFPSDEFAGLRARVVWDRVDGMVKARAGSRHVVLVNAGTIPDRGLFGVYLAGDERSGSKRVGELDEEMVFESRVGDVFLLGASSWRIEEITHDRVLVTPAPGQPGRMPFWHGDRPGRPVEFGRAMGELARTLVEMDAAAATARLRDRHGLDERAAENLLRYLHDQKAVTGELPSDRAVILERFKDDLGDWRVCIMSPLGARVHAPWATAVRARLERTFDGNIEMLWSDDGMVFRLPESDTPPADDLFFPAPGEVEEALFQVLGGTSLFASHFRENAARALLLPRRDPRTRQPLWSQRKRSADLLGVASRFPDFPVILETYRQVLKDVFDVPGLVEVLRQVQSRQLRVVSVDSETASPFAASLMFSYVANFIYDQDSPLAERRAQALSVDHAQLRELLGEAELRELLDADAIVETERRLQHLDAHFGARNVDGVHDLLLSLGDLTTEEVTARCREPAQAVAWLETLEKERRAVQVRVGGETRWIAAEDAGRFRDALGVVTPRGLPTSFLELVPDALEQVVSRYARTHGPFTVDAVTKRLGVGSSAVLLALRALAERRRVVEGEFLPGGQGREWCDAGVLKMIRQRSLARLRREVEPVEPAVLSRFALEWHHVTRPRTGLDALLSVIEQLQGAPIPASVLEADVLPARIEGYSPADLDVLCSAGEVTWRGVESLGPSDGRIALYLADAQPLLGTPPVPVEGELAAKIRALLQARGALFFVDLVSQSRAFGPDVLATLWDMVWAGEVTNDTLVPVRSMLRAADASKQRAGRGRTFRSRRAVPPGSEGRWSLVPATSGTTTERTAALVKTLLERHGVLTREVVAAEGVAGGWSALHEVLRAMEDAGRVRRGYYVAGLGGMQFALPGADERLRALRDPSDEARTILLAATDPANVHGVALPWPERADGRLQRAAGAHVVLHDGDLVAYARRNEKNVMTFLPDEEPERSRVAGAVAQLLSDQVEEGARRVMLVEKVDGVSPGESALGGELQARGFMAGQRGFMKRRPSGVMKH